MTKTELYEQTLDHLFRLIHSSVDYTSSSRDDMSALLFTISQIVYTTKLTAEYYE